jgi:hypothetical protein
MLPVDRNIHFIPCCVVVVLLLLPTASFAFTFPMNPSAPASERRPHARSWSRSETWVRVHLSKNAGASAASAASSVADFDYQEMRAQLEAMERQGIPSKDLPPPKRAELTGYVEAIIAKRPSTIPLGSLADVLPNTTWRLAFSTEAATLGDLPRDASVLLEFKGNDSSSDSRVDYVLEFTDKTFVLDRLAAKSTYQVAGANSPNPGLVTFTYQEITTNIFGFQNVGVGFFGLLKGKANYVESVFMDGRFWIERGSTMDGKGVYYNVYMKQGLVGTV